MLRITVGWGLALGVVLALMAVPQTVGAAVRKAAHAPVATPLSPRGLWSELDHAHRTVFGRDASSQRLACAYAHTALETGSGRHVYNWNFGNLGPQQHQAWHAFRATGRARFASYASARLGAVAYWRYMRDHHPAALAAFDRGDPAAAARAMAGRYYRAPLDKYSAAMVAIYREVTRESH